MKVNIKTAISRLYNMYLSAKVISDVTKKPLTPLEEYTLERLADMVKEDQTPNSSLDS